MAEIVNVNHETGDLSQYDQTITDGGDLSVSTDAALIGSYGLQVVIDDTNSISGRMNFASWPNGATHFRARFYLKPNLVTMASGDSFCIMTIDGGSGYPVLTYLEYDGADYGIRLFYNNDGGAAGQFGSSITPQSHYYEILLSRATTDASNDGIVRHWIDGNLQNTKSGLDMWDRFNDITHMRLGAVFGIDAGTSGTLYLDDLVIRNDATEIGPVPSGGDPPSTTMRLALGL
jgi:hypothetical protein